MAGGSIIDFTIIN